MPHIKHLICLDILLIWLQESEEGRRSLLGLG